MTTAIQPSSAGVVQTGSTARKLVAASVSGSTRRAWSGALQRLDAWLDGRPLTDTALAGYLAHLQGHGKSAAVGQTAPTGRADRAVLAGFRREAGDRGRGQVAGIRGEQADAAAALSANRGKNLVGLRDAALLTVASDAMLRVSEVADLDVADSTITIRRSKTDQEGAGAVLFIGPATRARVQA